VLTGHLWSWILRRAGAFMPNRLSYCQIRSDAGAAGAPACLWQTDHPCIEQKTASAWVGLERGAIRCADSGPITNHMDTVKFCPGCGTRRQEEWRFCAECGASVDGTPAATGRRNLAAPLAVFCGLVLAGVGLWMWILQPTERSGPPGSPTPPTAAAGMGNAAVAGAPGGATDAGLPDGHPPVERPALPDDVKQFIATLVEETEHTPDSVEAWTRLSEVQYRAARIEPSYYEAALESYRHLQEIDAGNADALRGLANVHYDKQQYVSARPYFEQYLEVRPDDHAARTDLATVRMHLGEVDEAIASYREIIAANPTFVQAHYNLGVALHRTGDDQASTEAFRHAREISTDDRVRARIDLILGQLGGPEPDEQGAAVTDGGAAPPPDRADAALAIRRPAASHAMRVRPVARTGGRSSGPTPKRSRSSISCRSPSVAVTMWLRAPACTCT